MVGKSASQKMPHKPWDPSVITTPPLSNWVRLLIHYFMLIDPDRVRLLVARYYSVHIYWNKKRGTLKRAQMGWWRISLKAASIIWNRQMKASDIVGGFLFIGLSIFCYIGPQMNLLPPGQVFPDSRFVPIAAIIGIGFLLRGLTSGNEPTTTQVVAPQTQQQVKTVLICPRCRSRVPEESKFCLECGEPLAE